MDGIFWLNDVEAYPVNPGGTYATNVDLSAMKKAGFDMSLTEDGVMVSHPLCKRSMVVNPGGHLLYISMYWAFHNAKRGKSEHLDYLLWSATYSVIPFKEMRKL